MSGTNTSNGPGVEGTSKSSYGVEGVSTSNDGLKGISTSSNGLSASSTSSYGVKGESSTSFGVYASTATGAAAIEGINTKGPKNEPAVGIAGGTSGPNGGYGVIGSAESDASYTYGVIGQSLTSKGYLGSGTGVEGDSGSGAGVEGTSTSGDGVSGTSTHESGVEGDSRDYYGVLGSSTVEVGGGFSGGAIGVLATSTNTTFGSNNGGDGALTFQVDAAGDITYAGSLNSVSSAANGAKVRTFGPRSSTPTVEDSGSAQLVAGAAAVRLDPTFASSIDPHAAYRVFLTPDGDTRGLYVATKTPAGFIVRETQGGRSTLAFDYRIIATALGAAGQRMSVATDSMLAHVHKAMLPKLHVRPRARAGSLGTPFTLP
ncbi:MAG: hypothetical protein IAI48_10500 [Candidatus Eremiobacteraeota bacterium]|nr:hypothetical protein [Candidatus Eremiobacteraeota bacterium]